VRPRRLPIAEERECLPHQERHIRRREVHPRHVDKGMRE
jgi:hypothetical protein